jgi:hypothetical protein
MDPFIIRNYLIIQPWTFSSRPRTSYPPVANSNKSPRFIVRKQAEHWTPSKFLFLESRYSKIINYLLIYKFLHYCDKHTVFKAMFNSYIAVICEICWFSTDAIHCGDADIFTPLHWTQFNLYSLKLFSWKN